MQDYAKFFLANSMLYQNIFSLCKTIYQVHLRAFKTFFLSLLSFKAILIFFLKYNGGLGRGYFKIL